MPFEPARRTRRRRERPQRRRAPWPRGPRLPGARTRTPSASTSATRRGCFAQPDDGRDWKCMAVYTTAPRTHRLGVVFPIEGDRWIVTLVGLRGHYPRSDDDAAFLEFAASLEQPDLHEAIRGAEPDGPVRLIGYANQMRRRFERLKDFAGRPAFSRRQHLQPESAVRAGHDALRPAGRHPRRAACSVEADAARHGAGPRLLPPGGVRGRHGLAARRGQRLPVSGDARPAAGLCAAARLVHHAVAARCRAAAKWCRCGSCR